MRERLVSPSRSAYDEAWLSLCTVITLSKQWSHNHNNRMHKGFESSSWGQSRWRSRGDAVYFGRLRLLLISLLFCIHSRSLCIFHSYFQTLEWKTGSVAIPGGRGSRGHARGYSAETRRYDWGRIGLGEGEEEGGGCSLKGSSVSGDVLVAVELVIHGKRKKKNRTQMGLHASF